MTKIDLSQVEFYRLGVSGMSSVVGNDWLNGKVAERVARYTITPPKEGAMGLKLYFKADYFGGGDQAEKINLRYYIGTSDSSHASAGPTSEYTGEFTFNPRTLEFVAETDTMLLPNKTYYLWLFPAISEFGWYGWSNADQHSLEAVGGLGLVYLGNGSGADTYLVYIKNDTSWEQYIPYIGNGAEWDMCT